MITIEAVRPAAGDQLLELVLKCIALGGRRIVIEEGGLPAIFSSDGILVWTSEASQLATVDSIKCLLFWVVIVWREGSEEDSTEAYAQACRKIDDAARNGSTSFTLKDITGRSPRERQAVQLRFVGKKPKRVRLEIIRLIDPETIKEKVFRIITNDRCLIYRDRKWQVDDPIEASNAVENLSTLQALLVSGKVGLHCTTSFMLSNRRNRCEMSLISPEEAFSLTGVHCDQKIKETLVLDCYRHLSGL